MEKKILLKRNNNVIDNQPKTPSTDKLDYGELAINYHNGVETIFFKNDQNQIVDFKTKKYFEDIIAEQSTKTNKSIDDLNTKINGLTENIDKKVDDSELTNYAQKTDLDGYLQEADLNEYAKKTDLEGYLQEADLNGYVQDSELTNYAKTSDLDNYAQKTDLDGYAKSTELGNYAQKSDLDSYAKSTELNNYAQKTDLDSYAKSTELNNYAQKTDLNGYAKTSDLGNYAQKSDLDGYAQKSDLNGYVQDSELTNYAQKSDLDSYAKSTELGNYAQKSELSNYAKTSDLNSYVKTSTLSTHESKNGTTTTAGHVKIINGDLKGKSYVSGEAAAAAHTHSDYAPASHNHDDVYCSLTDVDTKLTPIKNDIETLFAQSPNVSQNKVLWIGTSIPYGDGGDNNYPKLVADALGFELYNNSRAGSFVSYYPATPSWTTSAQVDAEFATGFSLSATKQETYDKYYNLLETIRRNERLGTTWRDEYITLFQSHSYEELIIPYIDGTKADCDIVIIDHGFNDRDNIFNVCSQHPVPSEDIISYWPADQVGGATNIEYPVVGGNAGWYWLTHLSDNRYYDGEVYMNTLRALGAQNNGGMKGEYFGAMAYVIEQIRKVNPRIRIVIGNYFSLDHGFDSMSSFVTKYILEANEQIAKYNGFQCVNVYQYTGLRNYTFTSNDGVTTTDMLRFCPDGVHPASDTTGQSNRFIANVYMKELRDSMIY